MLFDLNYYWIVGYILNLNMVDWSQFIFCFVVQSLVTIVLIIDLIMEMGMVIFLPVDYFDYHQTPAPKQFNLDHLPIQYKSDLYHQRSKHDSILDLSSSHSSLLCSTQSFAE